MSFLTVMLDFCDALVTRIQLQHQHCALKHIYLFPLSSRLEFHAGCIYNIQSEMSIVQMQTRGLVGVKCSSYFVS